MLLAYKQLVKQILNNKVFVALIFLLTILVSFGFFYIQFSIDGNILVLDSLSSLNEEQLKFEIGLTSNIFLARSLLAGMSGLTAIVLIMFFYRFFRTARKEMGCLKAIGFADKSLCSFFIVFISILSLFGALIGLICGYYASSLMIDAYKNTYLISELVKYILPINLILGLIVPTLIYCLATFLGYLFIRGKEAGLLINGNINKQKSMSKIADAIVNIVPIKNKFPLRIALRKPLSILLILTAIISFSICIVLGQSLYNSGPKVFTSQTIGHNYEYDTRLDGYSTEKNNDLVYIESLAKLTVGDYNIEQTIYGFYSLNELYELQNNDGDLLPVPNISSIYINSGIANTYGVDVGDNISINISGENQDFTVMEIATNAKSASIYMNAEELCEIIDAPLGVYNGILSMEKVLNNNATTISKMEHIDELERTSTSNSFSSFMNSVCGVVIGSILIFLALYMNFQDNTHDMMILHLMGFDAKSIRKILVDIYRPVIFASFLLTIIPSILIAKSIQRFYSISTNDYMPFGTNIWIIILIFILLNIIYQLVQLVFDIGIKRILKKDATFEITNLS